MKIYMIRHGQSTANLNNMLSTPETPLSEKGIEDAKRAGTLIKHLHFDAVLVSPYRRAIETMQNALPGVEGRIIPCLHECDCGNIEGEKYADMHEKYGARFAEILRVDDFTEFGGEDYANMRKRVREFMSIVEPLDCETVAAFSHAGFILTMLDEILDRPGKPGRNIRCDNGSVSVFEYVDGKWNIVSFNMTGQL